ncbi:eCIS core domain-containing protein [Haloferax larsenii]|uniref:eCIS core domain-containing protein n=1 Tax=Haloferax larsenii TaxID=302484 RepID=A0A1H7T313_HALLR|nr:DUF4157 domain-containing protein [Haloferax larsenii]SEL78915.1 protein of unknown function [Haloferax larsenii]
MGFRTARESTTEAERSSVWNRDEADSSRNRRRRRGPRLSATECENLFGLDMYRDGLEVTVQRLVQSHGAGQVRQWADEGMTVETMGKPRDMRQFRERQDERPAEVPKDIERRNAKSVQRSRGAHHEASKAGDAQVPDSVRDVISSPGQQLDSSIQQVIEERMGDNLGDVRIHTGPQAAKACEDINARAFTVGNHIAFNHGEYDPSSAEGQHVLAHELAHVRQQTGGAVSMLPQKGELEIDPDERLEREAEETAKRVMRGGELGIFRMRNSDVHVQRMPADMVPDALEMFKSENQKGSIGSFQQRQNKERIEFIEEEVKWAIDNIKSHDEALSIQNEKILDAKAAGDTKREVNLEAGKESIQDRIAELYEHIGERAEQIALTDEQREKLYGDNDFDGGEVFAELGWTAVKGLISLVPGMGPIMAAYEVSETALRQFWEQTDGSLTERLAQVKEQIVNDADTGAGDSQAEELGK